MARTRPLIRLLLLLLASTLAAAGLPVRAAGVQLAEELMSQLRRLARAEAPAQ